MEQLSPKKKAKELIEFFLNHPRVKLSDYSLIYLPTAQAFARKLAHEILDFTEADKGRDFWKQVLIEIDKYEE